MTENTDIRQSWQRDVEKWKTDLAFCREEIKILKRYLEDVSERPLSGEMKDDIAHFHGRLTDTSEKALLLIQEVAEYGKQLVALPFTEAVTASHSSTREKTLSFCKSYAGLKSSFVKFLAKSDIML